MWTGTSRPIAAAAIVNLKLATLQDSRPFGSRRLAATFLAPSSTFLVCVQYYPVLCRVLVVVVWACVGFAKFASHAEVCRGAQ